MRNVLSDITTLYLKNGDAIFECNNSHTGKDLRLSMLSKREINGSDDEKE